jgi:acyl-CoA thioesterase-1
MLKKIKNSNYRFLMIFSMISSTYVASAVPIKVAFIGASNTSGVGTSNPATGAYPIRVGNLLGAAYEVRNYGVSGTCMLKQGEMPYWNTAWG